MVKTGGGETYHAFSLPMEIIHCTSEKRKAHGKDVVVVVVVVVLVVVVVKRATRFLHRCRLYTARARSARLMVETGGAAALFA
jgi:hypothetical protein